jgi:G3E family GTPase
VTVQIVSGFLGAGKTSAIRAQLEQDAGRKLAVIVNDFGEASLDEVALSEGEPFRITNIAGACVCCTAPEGFVEALGAVLDAEPDRILIEPTGLARPQDLVDTVRRSPHRDRVRLAPVVVLLDPAQLERADGGSLFAEQVAAADVLVANRIDLCSPEALERFERFAAELWPAPLAVHRTRYGRLAPELLEWPDGEGERLPRAASGTHTHPHAHSTAGFVARSWRWPVEVVFSRERLVDALARLASGRAGAKLARLKGIFRTQEGVYRLEVAAGRVDERPSAFRRDSRVDVVLEGDADRALETAGEWLEAATLDEPERALSAERIELVAGDGVVHLIDRERLITLDDGVPDVSTLFPERSGAAARVRSLFAELGLSQGGHVVVVAGDGFASEPVPAATLCEGVLLHSLDGAPLPAGKGGPFRLLIPERAGAPLGACANVKGVAKLVLR